MKAIAGEFRRNCCQKGPARYLDGYAMLGLMLVLFGLVLIGVIIAPNLILKVVEKKRDREQQRITRIGDALSDSVQRRLIIPTYTNWPGAVPIVPHVASGRPEAVNSMIRPAFASAT